MERTPDDLEGRYREMTRTPAAVYKLATFATRTVDLLAHYRLLALASAEGRSLVSIAMGPKGMASRILGPAWGGAFTYCALESGKESAPGQPTLEELRTVYRADRLGPRTVVTGLVGGRVDYSLSPVMHNAAWGAFGRDAVYVPFEVDDLDAFIAGFVRPATRLLDWNLQGFSVTNPFKTAIMRHLDWIGPASERIGAVNTVMIREGKLLGFNTDLAGAMTPLEQMMGNLDGVRVGIVGAGGAARAVACGLADRGALVYVFARRREQAEVLGAEFGAIGLPLDALGSTALDVLVNTTPVGTRGHDEDESPVPADVLRGKRVVYDLVYNPPETRLLSEARRAGCRTLGGLEMLAEQAALQFGIWSGLSVPRKVMLEAAATRLQAGLRSNDGPR